MRGESVTVFESEFFYHELIKRGVSFFTGVPDSLLKSFCAYITDRAEKDRHTVAVNEGAAVALAVGFHLATGKTPLVYMQNSGIGNAVNPLLSLADPAVYRIPLLLIIGWRGEPGVPDEPQHITQGRVTPALFDAMDIPYMILSPDETSVKEQLNAAFTYLAEKGAPYALIARKDTFAPYSLRNKTIFDAAMSREEAIEAVMLSCAENSVIFATTGMASRELYELREKHGMSHNGDFLTVGSMGHASSIALGFALQRPEKNVICLDGDGAALMHLGAFAAIAEASPANFRHIALNNAAHDSVGGQPTLASHVSLAACAQALGYKRTVKVTTKEELRSALIETGENPQFIEVRVRRGARSDLGRPQSSPLENKNAFMEALHG
jgi:phosphonopyruvate decarboxylase